MYVGWHPSATGTWKSMTLSWIAISITVPHLIIVSSGLKQKQVCSIYQSKRTLEDHTSLEG